MEWIFVFGSFKVGMGDEEAKDVLWNFGFMIMKTLPWLVPLGLSHLHFTKPIEFWKIIINI